MDMFKLPRITQWETISLEAADEVTRQMAAAAERNRSHSYNALFGLALGVVCVLLALIKVAPANSSEATEEQLRVIYKEIEYSAQKQLGVDVVIHPKEGAPRPRLPESYDKIELRESTRQGDWLPDSLRFIYDGRMVGSLSLKRYIEFEVAVVQVNTDIAPHTLLNPAWLETSTMTLPAGSPVITDAKDLDGFMSRVRLRSGDMVFASRVQKAWDVQRGDTISLLMEGPGISVSSEAVAQGNAYLGQRVTVKRVGDNARFSGTLAEGPVVLIETEEGK
jgi:flagella basal body P-ring formation protein FlgA